jgi:hypothetical protein
VLRKKAKPMPHSPTRSHIQFISKNNNKGIEENKEKGSASSIRMSVFSW